MTDTKQEEDVLVTAFKMVTDHSNKGDKMLLELSRNIIERLNVVAELCNVLSRQIDMLADRAADLNTRVDMLEQRHHALLQAFYSHCQEVAGKEPVDDERTH